MVAYAGRTVRFIKKHGIEMFLLDSGAGADMVSKSWAPAQLTDKLRTAVHSMVFHTCNGKTISDQLVDVMIGSLGLGISPWVLKSTPPILSMGMRCMEEMHTFILVGGKIPIGHARR